MRPRLFLALLIAALALALQGCAGVLEFHQPAESRQRKQHEDPPGALLPGPRPVLPC